MAFRDILVRFNILFSAPEIEVKWLVSISVTFSVRYSVRKVVLRNFAKFTGKHLCQRLFFNKVAGLTDSGISLVLNMTLIIVGE